MRGIFFNTGLFIFMIFNIFTLSGCGEVDNNNTQSVYSGGGDSSYRPHITLYGDTNVTVILGAKSIEGDQYGYEAYDPQDGDITDRVKIVNDIDFSRVGQYSVTYSVEDSDGNRDVKYRQINIVDSSASGDSGDPYYGGQTYVGSIPTITVTDGDTLYLPLGRDFTPNASATDFEDGDLSANIEIGGDSVNIYQAGTYIVTYTVTDSDGNIVSKNQTIFVGDYGASSDSTYTTIDSLDEFKTWYKTECNGRFRDSLYNANRGSYDGEIDCSNRGLYNIDLNYISIFSTIKSLDLSHNNLSEIDFTPLAETRVIEKIDLSHNKFSYIDFSPLYNLKNINELWINNNNLNYTKEERIELYRGFNNRSFTIYF
jgi:hypothetical protein